VPTPPATRRLEPAVFTATLVLADLLALVGGLVLTWWLRFGTGVFPTPLGIPPLPSYLATLPVVAPLGLLVFHRCGLYRPHRLATWVRDLVRGGQALALLGLLLAAVAFFYREFSFSRTVLVGYVGVTTVLFVGLRRPAAVVHRALRRRGFGVQRVAIAGGGAMAARLRSGIGSCPGNGMAIVGELDGEMWYGIGDAEGPTDRALRPGRVRSLVKTHRVDRLLVTDPDLTHDERLDLVEACHGTGVQCDFVPDLFEVMMGRVRVEEIGGVPLVGSRLHPLGRIDRIKKRTLDIAVSMLGLLTLSPLLAVVALAVRLGSPGPVLFRQPRLGRDGREFDILKFRSMAVEAERRSGPTLARRGDGRATRVGQVLRRTSLDELPQLWNVLKGEMSLVGPRPERRFFVDRYERQIPRYLERHRVKSGITGWAQVHGLRGDTSIEERTRYDIWYVENWSTGLDIKILVLTLIRFLVQDEAY
jgi:exopolysaccharide biosynthesis polyprenyl glycosylphosphotransferase